MTSNIIKSVGYSQEKIIEDILLLHCKGGIIDCDPTYSKGNFYKTISPPLYKYDIEPQTEDTIRADCRQLPHSDGSLNVIMFDPPFVVSKGPSLSEAKKGSNIISSRFSSFGSIKELWSFYYDSMIEFHRVLKQDGVLIFKCQDTVSGGKQWLSSHYVIEKASEIGYYCKDIFVLIAKSRLISGKVKKQQHARKYHSYFLVFIKK